MTTQHGVATRLFVAATVALMCLPIGASWAQGNAAATTPKVKPAKAATDPQKEASIRELIRISDTEKLYQQSIRQMLSMYREQMPTVPTEMWKKMETKFSNVSEVLDALVVIYDKYYTQEDVDGLLAFYRSPIGKKYLQTLPAVQAEASAFGKEWGTRKGAEVDAEMRATQQKPKKASKK